MILRIMLRPSHRSFAWLSQNILSCLLVIDLQAGKFRTIPAMKYRPAVWSKFPQGSLTPPAKISEEATLYCIKKSTRLRTVYGDLMK